MRISVAGGQIELSDTLKTRVTHQLDTLVARYLGEASGGKVMFGLARSFFTCDDDATEHMARRLRRYRRRVNDHARALAQRCRPEIGRRYVLRPEKEERLPEGGSNLPAIFATVVQEQEMPVATLTVSDAVMQLDLADRPVLMFRNSASGGINVVYRRPDGHVGWLDPDPQA